MRLWPKILKHYFWSVEEYFNSVGLNIGFIWYCMWKKWELFYQEENSSPFLLQNQARGLYFMLFVNTWGKKAVISHCWDILQHSINSAARTCILENLHQAVYMAEEATFVTLLATEAHWQEWGKDFESHQVKSWIF